MYGYLVVARVAAYAGRGGASVSVVIETNAGADDAEAQARSLVERRGLRWRWCVSCDALGPAGTYDDPPMVAGVVRLRPDRRSYKRRDKAAGYSQMGLFDG